MRIFYSDRFLLHSQGVGHPECQERLVAIKKELIKLGCRFEEPKEGIDDKELHLVHKQEYVERLKELSAASARFPDNAFSKNTYNIAKEAASAAKEAAFSALEDSFSFALVRPPGHHAGKESFAGFCYINNIAFAIRSLQKAKKAGKVLLLDIDFHTGNGSWDIFYDDSSVYYLSFHCDPSVAYPGTGFESENTKHMQNVCLSPTTTDSEYLARFEPILKEVFKKFKPDVIAVSAGFDTYHKDPIAGLNISKTETYGEIGEIVAGLGKPTFSTLEGGYYLPELGEMAGRFISAFL